MTPLRTDMRPPVVLESFAAATTVGVVMTVLAGFLARHPATRAHLQRIAKQALPILLIAIGAMTLNGRPDADMAQ